MLEIAHRIRRATADDLPRLVPLWQEFMDYHRAFDPFFTRDEGGHHRWVAFLADKVDTEDWQLLVAEVDGRAVGYLIATVLEYPPVLTVQRYGYLQDVAVTAPHRGRGVGTALYREAERWFRDRGVERVELSVSVHNLRTRDFWRRLGFGEHVERLARSL